MEDVIIPLMLLLAGMVGVWLSAGVAVDAARKISKVLGLSEAFIGLTVMSIGTSFPEIFTHIVASIDILKNPGLIQKFSGIAVGTNIGSNFIQITLIMGVIALLTTVNTNKKILNFDYWVMMGAIVLVFLASMNGIISRVEGVILVLLYLVYLGYLTRHEKFVTKLKEHHKKHIFKQSALLIGGLAVLLFAANIVVNNSIKLTDFWGVSGSFVGVLVIGVGTALPEFTTAIRAIMKGSSGISLGTLVGSNITNPMLAMGIGAAISTYKVTADLIWFDLPFWFFISLVIWFFFTRGKKLFKSEAVFIIFCYLAYVFIRLKFLAGVI